MCRLESITSDIDVFDIEISRCSAIVREAHLGGGNRQGRVNGVAIVGPLRTRRPRGDHLAIEGEFQHLGARVPASAYNDFIWAGGDRFPDAHER